MIYIRGCKFKLPHHLKICLWGQKKKASGIKKKKKIKSK